MGEVSVIWQLDCGYGVSDVRMRRLNSGGVAGVGYCSRMLNGIGPERAM